ncbi:MAG TPA: class II aldolase/adducin family protein [Trebonia sp.]|jgi:ribulose-5-phosphate 4-epimerase/fuculose-1-phosphate aldolase|nr:class II aldolase/adducin family protein [Trebonia sp.]
MDSAEDYAEQRREVAAATRMLVDEGILNYSGHLSVRVGDGQTILIQPVDEPRAELRPDRVLTVNLDREIIAGTGRPPSETAIHTEIYRARPDVGAVAHFHHDPTTVFTVAGDQPIVPVKNHASRWLSGVPVHPDPSHISSTEQGQELAATLGGCQAALLRSHGEVVVAENIRTLFADVVHFVENANLLARAMTLGKVHPLSADECASFQATFKRQGHARKLWIYYTAVAAAAGRLPAELQAAAASDTKNPEI